MFVSSLVFQCPENRTNIIISFLCVFVVIIIFFFFLKRHFKRNALLLAANCIVQQLVASLHKFYFGKCMVRLRIWHFISHNRKHDSSQNNTNISCLWLDRAQIPVCVWERECVFGFVVVCWEMQSCFAPRGHHNILTSWGDQWQL